ncbi:MAG: TIGR04133 family radical SAM/SPASM protein [Bacteroidales bacterium]|nr:TIGR04133 family radical SAM/SPASM protein [Candidatus Physcousia equi]
MGRLPIKTRVALEIDRHLRHERAAAHPLKQLFWECTLRCNVHCLHCGSDCASDELTPDMPASDFLQAIDQLTPHVNPHHTMIIISGGEPLVRPDLEEVGRELYKREYPWGIVTNGLLLTRNRLDRLMQAGMHTMTVSLDGLEADHNWLRRHPHSFERAYAAIRLMRETPQLKWDIVSCINQRSFPHLQEIREMLVKAGVREWRVFTIVPMGRAKGNAELQLSGTQMRQLMDFIVETRRQGRILMSYSCEGFLGRYEGRVRSYLYTCQAGLSVAGIRVDGSITGCNSIRSHYDQGNIYRDNIWEVWQNAFQTYRQREWAKQSAPCADCSLFRYCEGGPMHLRDEEGQLMFCHIQRMSV